MDKSFHLFVRRHPAGVSAAMLTHPHLASFAADLPSARADVARVAGRLLARSGDSGALWREATFWPDLRVKRVDVVIRAVQHGRLLPVPMRFTVVTHAQDAAAAAAAKKGARVPIRVLIPRLGVEEMLHDPDDLDVYVEEIVRHELYLAPLARLIEVAWVGDESIETLVVSARPRVVSERKEKKEEERKKKRSTPGAALSEACRRLNDEAAAGLLERAWQRDGFVNQLSEALNARTRASVLLVGQPSVGKTAIVHELAHRIEDAAEGTALHGTEIYSTSGSRIVAGMRYLGQWQARVERMIDELRTRKAALHLDSLVELLAAGRADTGLDVARHLLPAVESGEIVLICEATPEDVARAERTHAAFVQALRAIAVPPLEPEPARQALASAALRIARARKVRFDDEALARAIDLTERFGTGAVLPGGAVELLRASAHRDAPVADGEAEKGRVVGGEAVTTAFTARTGYPRELVDPAIRLDPDLVLQRLEERVVGQPAAMALLRNLVVTLKTGLADPARPLGSFLLLGPTGVGKTESALSLAAYLFGDEKRMARFDMSEYAAPGSAARLVSDVGGAEGTLARRVREHPFGIVLLDEVEKADAGVHDLLLQILGEGRLTDATGRTVSFRNTVVLLTSNLGAETAGRSLGFGDATVRSVELHYLSAAAAFFRPELLNRFDQIVPYHPLSAETVALIARRALDAALSREGLVRRGIAVRYTPEVVTRLAAVGFDARYGARPLKRAIEQAIVAPLALLLAQQLPRAVSIVVEDGSFILSFA